VKKAIISTFVGFLLIVSLLTLYVSTEINSIMFCLAVNSFFEQTDYGAIKKRLIHSNYRKNITVKKQIIFLNLYA